MGSVNGIKELVDAGMKCVPAKYVRPLQDRPKLSEVSYADQIPIIDLNGLLAPRSNEVIESIGRACEDWGLFQVINHGIPKSIIEKMRTAVEGFFQYPAVERMKYHSDDVCKPVAYVTSFNQQKEQVLNWKDSLRFRFSSRIENFNYLPEICRQPALEYCEETKRLGSRLYAALSRSLGLSPDFLDKYLQSEVANIHLNMHYYPPCPDPNLTLGLSAHSDPNVLTLLLQSELGGLQLFKNGVWMAVRPIPDSFVVNIGDQMQIFTNGKYKTVEHRVITNAHKPRISLATFFGPADETRVGPLPKFIDKDHPPLYRETLYKEYVSNFYNKGLARTASLDFASINKR